MAQPSAQPIQLKVATVDITANVDYQSMRLERQNLEVGYLDFEYTAYNGETFSIGDDVTLDDTALNSRLFTGNITELSQRKLSNGVFVVYRVRAADLKNRLRRAIVPYLDLLDSDSNILNALFNNAFPDLTDLFDLSGIGDLLADDLAFSVNNLDLLESLQRFQDAAGVGYLSFSPTGADVANYFYNPAIVSFSGDAKYLRAYPPPYDTYATNPTGYGTSLGAIGAGGAISGNYVRLASTVSDSSFAGAGYGTIFTIGELASNTSGTTSSSPMLFASTLPDTSFVRLTFYVRSDTTLSSSQFNLAIEDFLVSDSSSQFQNRFSSALLTSDDAASLTANTWTRFSITTPALSNVNLRGISNPFRLSLVMYLSTTSASAVFDISNIVVDVVPSDFDFSSGATYVDGSSAGLTWAGDTNDSYTLVPGGEALNWDSEPPASDFDIDVQNGDEFASDIEFDLGSPDYFNTAFVIGGYEEVSVDWTYESDGEQDHINLETEFRDYTIYRNDGTDGTPSWTTLDAGIWGTDELADKDVLYAPEHHWLYFASNPPNLAKSVRVAGKILKPVRVRVDGGSDGEPVLASTVYDESITSEDAAVTRGQAELNKRNAPANLRFKTYHGGLLPGQQINVTDSARGLNQDVIIQRILTTWLGAGAYARHEVECGVESPQDAASLIAGNDLRSRPTPPPATVTTPVAVFLVDEDGTQLIDEDGTPLYEVT